MNWIIMRINPYFLLVFILLSPFILLYAVGKMESVFDPEGHERGKESSKIFNETLYGEELEQELDRCDVYVDDREMWDICFNRVFREITDRKLSR